MILPFLLSRGFRDLRDERKAIGKSESQTIHATAPGGERLAMRVKLCWRRVHDEETYSAVQLLAKVKNRDDWEGSLQQLVERARRGGATYFLFVQREGQRIAAAAQVSLSDLVPIWCDQRRIGEDLLARGGLGNRKKNHAMNGSSPTLWLRDDRAPTVAAALWEHKGVRNLVADPTGEAEQALDDTFDDLPGIDYSLLGSDGPSKTVGTRSNVKRDPQVRDAVLRRAARRCEREDCGEARDYPGFLDVHHILGAEKSDRVWNCVAVCPNCHREAHMAPNRDQINAGLLVLAMKSKVAERGASRAVPVRRS